MTRLVVPYDPTWRDAFAEEAKIIRALLGCCLSDIHHIGSTAIPDMPAKPIIDMLGVAASLASLNRGSAPLIAIGYEAMGAYGIEGRRYFRKSNALGVRTHHFHVYANDSLDIERHLAFRDYMRTHPSRAAEYAALKAELLARGKSGEAYQDGKAAFIKAAEADALTWSRQRA